MTKPAIIRYFDKATKSKAILSVFWSDREGNPSPYLSVNIKAVKLNGEKVYHWKEQKEAINSINKDLGFLVDNHLTSLDGFESHAVSNACYRFEMLKQQLIEKPYTKEQQQADLAELEKAFIMPEKIKKDFGCNLHNAEKSIKRRMMEPYYYAPSWDRMEVYLMGVFQKSNINGASFRFSRDLKTLVDWLATFRENYQAIIKTSKKQAIDKNQVWTVEKFSEKYDLSYQTVQSMVFDENYKETLKDHLQGVAEESKLHLESLTNKYNIPTIKG